VTSSTFQRIDTDLAAVGSRGLEVHKEIHLLVPQFFEMVLERINSGDFNCYLRQTVPSVVHGVHCTVKDARPAKTNRRIEETSPSVRLLILFFVAIVDIFVHLFYPSCLLSILFLSSSSSL